MIAAFPDTPHLRGMLRLMSGQQSAFFLLPEEVIEEIIRKLDAPSLLRCLQVNRNLKKIIDESSELQYAIELYKTGMEDTGVARDMPYSERLAKLKDRQYSWSMLNWKGRKAVRLDGLCHAYELVGGVFAKAMGGQDLHIAWLPSSDDELGHDEFRRDEKMRARDFALDPGQDLIIFVEDEGGPWSNVGGRYVELYIRTITTNEAHPLAKTPKLRFFIPPNPQFFTFVRSIMLQIADDVVAVFLSTGYQRLVIWNWKEGYLISDSVNVGYELADEIWDFSFISPRAYILTSYAAQGVIQIYSFESKRDAPSIHVIDLHLPELDENVRVRAIATHTGPFETPSRTSTWNGNPRAPFTTAERARLHVICVQYIPLYNNSNTRFCLFVKNEVFLRAIEEFWQAPDHQAKSLSWERWGPRNSRFSSLDASFTWLRYVHGSRVVCPQVPDTESGVMQVLDFNIQASRPLHSSSASPPLLSPPSASRSTCHPMETASCPHPQSCRMTAQRQVHVETTLMPASNIFRAPVKSSLPYAVTTVRIEDHYSAFMIDEERIVGLKAEGVADEELKELHVYYF